MELNVCPACNSFIHSAWESCRACGHVLRDVSRDSHDPDTEATTATEMGEFSQPEPPLSSDPIIAGPYPNDFATWAAIVPALLGFSGTPVAPTRSVPVVLSADLIIIGVQFG